MIVDFANPLHGFFSCFNYKIKSVSEGRQNVVLPTKSLKTENFEECRVILID